MMAKAVTAKTINWAKRRRMVPLLDRVYQHNPVGDIVSELSTVPKRLVAPPKKSGNARQPGLASRP